MTISNLLQRLYVGQVVEGLDPQGPDLIEQTPVAPNITGRRVLPVVCSASGAVHLTGILAPSFAM